MFRFDEFNFFNPSPNFRELILLKSLSTDPNISQDSLSKMVGIVPSMVNKYLKDFEEKNYVIKKGENRRKMTYEITEDGLKRLQFLIVSYTEEVSKMYESTRKSFEKVLKKISNDKLENIYLYGAGVIGSTLLKVLKTENINIKGFIDDSNLKIGEKLHDIEIISPNNLKESDYDAIIIASFKHYKKILEKAKTNKLEKLYIFKIDEDGNVSLKKED